MSITEAPVVSLESARETGLKVRSHRPPIASLLSGVPSTIRLPSGSGARFAGLVHHTDAMREYAYDRQSKIGKLDKALDEAIAKGWTVVDMKRDWKTVFPEQP